MPRYRLLIEYDGTLFAGWQQQAEGETVQGALQDAIQKFSGERVSVRGAGRTDSGVHALGQVAHFDLTKDWDPFRVQEALNYHVKPRPIAVLECALAATGFDARFSATRRHYSYRILCRRAPPVLDRNRVWWINHALDADVMAEAARVLTGHHDFTTFRAAQCQALSPFKTIDAMTVTRDRSEIRIDVSARSFLHNQVRSMVGSLKLAGDGKWTVGDLEAALAARDRTHCGPVAPASGLFLAHVEYGNAISDGVVSDDDEE